MTVPFIGKVFTFTQPDGTTIDLRCFGDQHYAVFEDLDGYVVIRDPVSGYYQYARLNNDETYLLPTGAQAGRVDPAALGLSKHVRVKREAARVLAATAHDSGGRKRRWEERIEERRRAALVARAASLDGRAFAPPSEATVGDYTGLCILIEFPDVPATINRAEVDHYCNQEGYSGFGNNGSVYDYFLDVSRGRLRYTNVVTQYYTAAQPRSHYTNELLPDGLRARELIREALSHLVSDGFDFSPMTADSSGFMRALNVFYAGPVVNNWSKGLWPHSWHLGVPFNAAPGRQFMDYQFTNMGSELTLGTFCHENGHMICDFPDLYDYGDESYGIGQYCLMCFGGPDEKNPVRVGAYLNRKAGWAQSVTPVVPGTSGTLAADQDDFLIHAKSPDEYFLIENRLAQGRDASLPASGLAIWHIDESGSNENEFGTPFSHYECALEQADGRTDLEDKTNAGDAGDLWSTSTQTEFRDDTVPNSRWWDATSSGLAITQIGAPGNQVAFVIPGGDDEEDQVNGVSEPGFAIPDDQDDGVQDAITLDADGNATFIEISLDIQHSYRGDLIVTLFAPSGAAAVLHDRMGGGQDNLIETYDSSSSPGLQSLLGEPIRGDWILQVADAAPADTGSLRRWEITVRGDSRDLVEMEESPGVTIPDDDSGGIERVLSTDHAGTVGNVTVDIDITHSYIRDLVVELVSPAGTSVDLHRRTGGSADNIIRSFTAETIPALAALSGETTAGDWRLRVSDHQGADVGKLRRWALMIVPEIPN